MENIKEFIDNYNTINELVIKYFNDNINSNIDNTHSHNYIDRWFFDNYDYIIIVYNNYYSGYSQSVSIKINEIIQ